MELLLDISILCALGSIIEKETVNSWRSVMKLEDVSLQYTVQYMPSAVTHRPHYFYESSGVLF